MVGTDDVERGAELRSGVNDPHADPLAGAHLKRRVRVLVEIAGAMHYIARLESQLDHNGEPTRKEHSMPERVLDVRTELPGDATH